MSRDEEFPAPERKPKIVIGLDDLDGPPVAVPDPVPAPHRTVPPARPKPGAAIPSPPRAAKPKPHVVVPVGPASEPPPAPVGPPLRGISSRGAASRAEPGDPVCAVREVIEGEFSPEDGFILPVPGLQRDCVLIEARDGSDIRSAHANEVAVRAGDRDKYVIRANDIRAQVQITDARLTVACSKYDKGGGWIGGRSR